MNVSDKLSLRSPTGKAELAGLLDTKVGKEWVTRLFPALIHGMRWICTAASPDRWEFDGVFFGLQVCQVVVTVDADSLTLAVK